MDDNNVEITTNPTESVRVLDQYVLIKQIMKKKGGRIIRDASKNNKDIFDFRFEILAKGPKCERDFNIGECPIFGEHVQFSGLKVIEKDDNGTTSIVIVHENEIIAIDLDPVKI